MAWSNDADTELNTKRCKKSDLTNFTFPPPAEPAIHHFYVLENKFSTMLLSLSSVLISSIALSYASTFQNGEKAPLQLQERVASYGGYALAASPCPQDLLTCPGGNKKCCPSAFQYCLVIGGVTGTACCPNCKEYE